MPPKSRFTNNDIITAAFDVLRESGWSAVSSRSIAKALNASTTPIYTYMKSMKNLEDELVKKSLDLLISYQKKIDTGDKFLDKGVGYIIFAMNEKNVFRFIHDENNMELYIKYGEGLFNADLNLLAHYPLLKGFSDDQKRKFLFVSWVFSHGLADLVSNSLQKYIPALDSDKAIADFLFETFVNHWEGIKNSSSS